MRKPSPNPQFGPPSNPLPTATSAPAADPAPGYAELWCLSNFSFLRGASHPQELIERASALGYTALALGDECSLGGIVRAHSAAKQNGLKLLVGAQFQVPASALSVLALPQTSAADTRAHAPAKRESPHAPAAAQAAQRAQATNVLPIAAARAHAAKPLSDHAMRFPPNAVSPPLSPLSAVKLELADTDNLHGMSTGHLAMASMPATATMAAAATAAAATATQAQATEAQAAGRFHAAPESSTGDVAAVPGASRAPFVLIVLATSLAGYGNLCQFITRARRVAPKGQYTLAPADVTPFALHDCLVLAAPARSASDAQLHALALWLQAEFAGRCWLAVNLAGQLDDAHWLQRMRALQSQFGAALPLVAAGDVHMHLRSRKPLQDVLTATRLGKPLADCGWSLQPNAERHLRARTRLAQLYPPDLLSQSLQVAARCHFSLDEIKYQYPDEVVPPQTTATAYLRELTEQGARKRWPAGTAPKVRQQIEHELALIAELRYEHYFLTVYDIVRFARGARILCQGRGSAANSVVCFCLGVTEVDPARMSVLFERFISRERDEPPDIDIDFEHERREEVIQYLYGKYGRDRAGLTAVVAAYRPKSAIRDVGKALGFAPAQIDHLAQSHSGWDGVAVREEALAELGLNAQSLAVRQWLELAAELIGFPRHRSQHVGGFVLTRGPLSRLVPIENAAMKDRTVIEWDKDDLDALGLLKVDVLALGMLTALRKAFDLLSASMGRPFGLADVPAEDPATYAMIGRADTIGVFQIESRAQMSMLPRLKPTCFYDLVIEVAIVRPGPIQGGMVHPYLRRRQQLEPVSYREELRDALERTLGVPIFQEQVMQIAMIAADFSPGEADGLRRAMAAWRRKGDLHKYRERLIHGMTANGYELSFAEAIFEQIKGFSEYGFPESHAASFALLVYASSWLKCHHPAEFLAAMLNSQPLGFYTAHQLIADARRHGVQVLPVDVVHSAVDCTLAAAGPSAQPKGDSRVAPIQGVHSQANANANANAEDGAQSHGGPRRVPTRHPPAVRLGLRHIMGLSNSAMQRIADARQAGPLVGTDDLARRAQLDAASMRKLAAADALHSLAGHRRQQVWQATALHPAPTLLRDAPITEVELMLPAAPEAEEIVWDMAASGLSLRRHPLALLRPRLARQRCLSAEQLQAMPDGSWVRHCGIVVVRQQPPTANGTVFITLEDETGMVQTICWPQLREANRKLVVRAELLAVQGRWQREGAVCNLIAHKLVDVSAWLGPLRTSSRDFQ